MADVAALHAEHYRSCNCLADSAVCCVRTCPCRPRSGGLTADQQDDYFAWLRVNPEMRHTVDDPRRCQVCNETEGHAADCPWPNSFNGQSAALAEALRSFVEMSR